MTHPLKRSMPLVPLLATVLLAGCVSQSKYDALNTQYQQAQQQNAALEQQVTANKAQISRLQGAIKYTVNSDLLFPSGSWNMSASGQKIIAGMAQNLASMQQSKIVVNGYTDNAPIGPELMRQGVNTNQDLSQKRADVVMQFLDSHGVRPDMVSAQGHGESDPVASNDTAQGRGQNRRVEITLAN
jgi:chemotaxis protein MotB